MKYLSIEKIILSILISFSVLITTAHAELIPVTSIFSEMDVNKDGVINRQEINKKSILANEFDKVDKNNDDNLDFNEFEHFIVSVNI